MYILINRPTEHIKEVKWPMKQFDVAYLALVIFDYAAGLSSVAVYIAVVHMLEHIPFPKAWAFRTKVGE